MAVRTIIIKDAYLPEMVEVFGEGYSEIISDPTDPNVQLPNPQTKAQFASEKFDSEWRNFVIQKVQRYRKEIAQQTIDDTSIIE
jgi:hypothetical protein